MADLRIEVLGGFRVAVGARTVSDEVWRRRKPAALVKLLALARVLQHVDDFQNTELEVLVTAEGGSATAAQGGRAPARA